MLVVLARPGRFGSYAYDWMVRAESREDFDRLSRVKESIVFLARIHDIFGCGFSLLGAGSRGIEATPCNADTDLRRIQIARIFVP